ncbi:MAG: GNAT family N-acetyltransferase [Planctomycetota bacterium]|nr:GNAT family N-acetyltransferase [Planctomycetota bacterium]
MAHPPSIDPAGDARFWEAYREVAGVYAHEMKLVAVERREAAVFDLPVVPRDVPGVPPARLWHNLKGQFIAIDATGFDTPQRVMLALREQIPLATATQDIPGGIRFRCMGPTLDLKQPLGGQRHAIRHALLQALSLRRWWRTTFGSWAAWRAGAVGPVLEVRRIPPHHTWALRQKVLRPHQDIREMAWDGDTEESTRHFGGYVDGALAGVATLLQNAPPTGDARPALAAHLLAHEEGRAWQVRGMATDGPGRGCGLGRALLKFCAASAAVRGGSGPGGIVWCNARTSALAFYERAGFVVASGEFELPHAGTHVVMVRAVRAGDEDPYAR